MLQRFPGATRRAPRGGALLVCALSILPALAQAAQCRPPGPLREAPVARVVDGDTLRLADGRSVRLIGLNAPERGRAGRRGEAHAEAATRHLQQLVAANGGRVRLAEGEQAADRYGRRLAHAFGRDGRNWEAELLAAGLGFAVALAPNTALVDCHLAAERQARAARRGVWRRSPLQAAGQLQEAGFAVLHGRVDGVERRRGALWLTLDGTLQVRIAAQQLGLFDERALRALRGQQVETRGWVVERRGSRGGDAQPRWQLHLDHPALLERR